MANIQVDLVYVHSNTDLFYASYTVPSDTTITQLLALSEVRQYYKLPADELLQCGIFNVVVTPQYVLQHNDRVEIYRPLTITPIEARQIRAQKQRNRT